MTLTIHKAILHNSTGCMQKLTRALFPDKVRVVFKPTPRSSVTALQPLCVNSSASRQISLFISRTTSEDAAHNKFR